MTRQDSAVEDRDRIGQVMTSVQIPLENIEFTIEKYLLDNGCRLDTETRFLLARVRDSVARVAVSTRRLADRETRGASPGPARVCVPPAA